MRIKSLALTLGLLLAFSGPAHAAGINYIFTGTFDGSLGTTPFTDQAFTITLTGDTANVTSGGGEFANVASAATFSIGAFNGSLTGDLNEVIVNPSFGPGVGGVVFGQLVLSPPGFVAEGAVNAPLSTYDLTTAFALTPSSVTQTKGSTYLTTGGNLVFGDITSVAFEADLTPTPLPSSWMMFLVAFVGLGFFGVQRQRQRQRA